MNAQVVIAFLLVCCAAALPVEDCLYDCETIEAMQLGLHPYEKYYVLDDDNNPVELTMDDDDDETEEETRKDLRNRVFFHLHTRNYPGKAQQLFIGKVTALKQSDFDPQKETIIITHGWLHSGNSESCTLIRDAFINHGDYNVIVVDWNKISLRPYVWVTKRVPMVSEFVATMINFLEQHDMDLSRTTLIGHSLGAHIAGLAARNAKGTVRYVVGLDPALPGFITAGPGSRIATGDASNVEIIHTNAGFLGYDAAIGDIDFYPNGGSKQPGCIVDPGGACSHARAFHFYAESINTKLGFHAQQCKSYRDFRKDRCQSDVTSVMGGYKDKIENWGKFFLYTRSRSPYAMGPLKI